MADAEQAPRPAVLEPARSAGASTATPSVEAAPPAKAHDRAWFDALFAEQLGAVHRYLLRRGAGPDAEDLCADVFATAWRRRADVPTGHELAWLYRTAGYLLANFWRKGRAVPVAEVPEDREGALSADPADLAVRDDAVRRVLARLSPKDRQVLLLHAWEGLDGEALGRALGLTRGGAAAALSRARSRLRAAWQGEAD